MQGGLSAEPGTEAHGGYTFCGLAALCLLGEAHHLNIPRLEAWLVQRQGGIEGGFNGRTNKLTDSCYSYWQGAAVALLRNDIGGRMKQSCKSTFGPMDSKGTQDRGSAAGDRMTSTSGVAHTLDWYLTSLATTHFVNRFENVSYGPG